MVKASTVARDTLVAQDNKSKPQKVQGVSPCTKRHYLHWAIQGKNGLSYWCIHRNSEWVVSK